MVGRRKQGDDLTRNCANWETGVPPRHWDDSKSLEPPSSLLRDLPSPNYLSNSNKCCSLLHQTFLTISSEIHTPNLCLISKTKLYVRENTIPSRTWQSEGDLARTLIFPVPYSTPLTLGCSSVSTSWGRVLLILSETHDPATRSSRVMSTRDGTSLRPAGPQGTPRTSLIIESL